MVLTKDNFKYKSLLLRATWRTTNFWEYSLSMNTLNLSERLDSLSNTWPKGHQHAKKHGKGGCVKQVGSICMLKLCVAMETKSNTFWPLRQNGKINK